MWKPGCCSPARHDVVDEALEHALLARRVERPRRVVVAVAIHDAEQVLKPAVGREDVTFEVEEHIAVRRLGQRREPLVRLDRRDELVDTAAFAPSVVLHPRLLADAGQRGLADPVKPGRDRQAQRPQRRHDGAGTGAARGRPGRPGRAGQVGRPPETSARLCRGHAFRLGRR